MEENRTEPATPRRREEARRRGQVARSSDLVAAGVLLSALVGLLVFGGRLVGSLRELMVQSLNGMARSSTEFESVNGVGLAALPVFAIIFAAAIAVNMLQFGFLFTLEPLEPKAERLDPFTGAARFLSRRNWIRVLMGVLKLTVLAAALAYTLWRDGASLLELGGFDVAALSGFVVHASLALGLRAAIVLAILGLIDYAYQRVEHEWALRMTPAELREELRRFEGDPKLRERRRESHRQIAYQRMMQRVPEATVVVTNPTHYAVALAYETGVSAPRVVAKGADLVAQRIRETAGRHDIPIIERAELARAIFRECKVDQEIPRELFQAVAEVLAFVFRIGRLRTESE